MRNIAASILLLFIFLQAFSLSVSAQEENKAVIKQGTHYYDLKLHSLQKFDARVERQQDRLIKKLQRKEKHFAHKLKSSDSLAYAQYKKQSAPSFDSIKKVSKSDTGTTAAKFSKQKNASVDSLRGVANFVQSKSGLTAEVPSAPSQNAEMGQLQGKLNFRTYITQLITQRTNSLKSLTASNSNIPGISGIEKQVFYGKAKMKTFKDMEEDPTKAEDKAMEYLQGTEGFDKSMSGATQGVGNNAQGMDANQLEAAGYQTKQLMQKSLFSTFGAAGLSSVTTKVSGQISEWQKSANDITGNITQTKQSLEQIKNIEAPSFKINPMRGLPFWKRIQKQYSWQTTRASADGTSPATIQPALMVGFKQSPKLSYGLGIATTIGLGQSWSNIKLSFQGIGLRSFITWQWQYGLGIYIGYERMYDRFAFMQNTATTSADITSGTHSTSNYSESVLLGLTKTYSMNKKYNGQIQVLYDIWWQQKGMRSPIIFRIATTKL